MTYLGLAKVRKVAPKLKLEKSNQVTEKTLQGVITHRYEIMTRYADLLKKTAQAEIDRLKGVKDSLSAQQAALLKTVADRITQAEQSLKPTEKEELEQALSQNKVLATLVNMRDELTRVWASSTASSEQLLQDLQVWCQQARQSGIKSLEQFALRLQRYAA